MNITDIFFQSNNTEVVANASNTILAHQIVNALAGGGTPVMLITAGCMIIFYYNKAKGNANTSNGFFRWLGRSSADFCRGFFSSENNNDVEAASTTNKEISMHDLPGSHSCTVKFLIDSEDNLISGQLIANEAVKKISFSKTKENNDTYIIISSTDFDGSQDDRDCTDCVKPAKDNENHEEKSGTMSLLEDGSFKLTYEVSKGKFFEKICRIGEDCKDFFTPPDQSLVESEAEPLMALGQSLVK